MLKKSLRLRNSGDFGRVYKFGRRITGKHLQIFSLNSRTARLVNQNVKRFGFVVSKKATRTVAQRNRVKRILRALVQKSLKEFQGTNDYILQAKKNIDLVSPEELRNEYGVLIKKLHARI